MPTTTREGIALVTACILALAPAAAIAAAFQVLQQGASRLGTAFSGTASVADDATTVFFNPAGMARFDRARMANDANLVVPSTTFTDQGSVNSGGAPLSGPDDSVTNIGFVPNFYYVRPLNDRWAFGFGVSAPFGAATEYDDDWVGRYHGTDSELTLINVNPTVSYRFSDRLSVGVGANYQHVEATLKNEVDSFAACTQAPGASAGSCAADGLEPGRRSQDSSARVEGDDADVTIDLSMLFEFSSDTRIGAVFRQGGDFELEGDATFSQSGVCTGNANCNQVLNTLAGDVAAGVDIPDTVIVSFTHALNGRWSVHTDIAWIGWSSIDRISVVNADNGRTVSTLDLDYSDTMRYGVGLTYKGAGPWTWRGGIGFDEAPQTDAELQTPRIPDEDRVLLGMGFNYAFSDKTSIDFGYVHLFADEFDINRTVQGNTLTGKYDPATDILGLQGNLTF